MINDFIKAVADAKNIILTVNDRTNPDVQLFIFGVKPDAIQYVPKTGSVVVGGTNDTYRFTLPVEEIDMTPSEDVLGLSDEWVIIAGETVATFNVYS